MADEPGSEHRANTDFIPLYMAEYMERNAHEHGEMRAEFYRGLSSVYGVIVAVILAAGAAGVAVAVQFWLRNGGG